MNNILIQPNDDHPTFACTDGFDPQKPEMDITWEQHQILFKLAIKENSFLILLASALMTNAIRTLSTFAQEIEGIVDKELQILSNNTISSI